MNWDTSALAYLQTKQPISVRWLFWVSPQDYDTGARTDFGYWNGEDVRTFTIKGQARTYIGALGQLAFPAVDMRPGTIVQTTEISMAISEDAEAATRGYDMRFAPADIHAAMFNPDTGTLIGFGRSFKGVVEEMRISTGPVNGTSAITLTLASAARRGTMSSHAKKSHQYQKRRKLPNGNPDKFRNHGSLGPTLSDAWATS